MLQVAHVTLEFKKLFYGCTDMLYDKLLKVYMTNDAHL